MSLDGDTRRSNSSSNNNNNNNNDDKISSSEKSIATETIYGEAEGVRAGAGSEPVSAWSRFFSQQKNVDVRNTHFSHTRNPCIVLYHVIIVVQKKRGRGEEGKRERGVTQ